MMLQKKESYITVPNQCAQILIYYSLQNSVDEIECLSSNDSYSQTNEPLFISYKDDKISNNEISQKKFVWIIR